MFKNVPNFVRFALSLTVAEICAHLWCFFYFSKNVKFSKTKNRNIQKRFALIIDNPCDPKNSVRFTISLTVLNLNFRMAPIRSVLTQFLPKTNQGQFKVYWSFVQDFKSFFC